MIEIQNKKLHDLIVMKDELVNDGRKISRDMETIDIKVKKFEAKEKSLTKNAKVPQELLDRGDVIVKTISELDSELNTLIKTINESKLEVVPKAMKDEHLQLLKDREQLERDRNKIALKVQKVKDRIIPIVQKEVKPMMKDPFDDIETAKAKDGKVLISTFNHLEDFKKRFKR